MPTPLDAINRVLLAEGGLVNNPADPGGLTKYGISQRSYPDVDIANLTAQQAEAIYQRDFWQALNLDKLPFPLAFQVLDFAVNAGKPASVVTLQRLLGVTQDGVLGPVTAQAAGKQVLPPLVFAYLEARLIRYTQLPTFKTFGAGWTNRVARCLYYARTDLWPKASP